MADPAERPDIDRLADTVREGLRPTKPTGPSEWDKVDTDANAALDELVALARQGWDDRTGYLRDFLAARERAEATEARVAELEAKNERLREEARKGQEPLAHLILDATTILRAHRIARAALDGDGGGA